MIHKIVEKVAAELESLILHNISVERALDLIEASTNDLNEIIAINTMRESLAETEPAIHRDLPHPSVMLSQSATTFSFHV